MNKIILAIVMSIALLGKSTKLFSQAAPSENKMEITDSTAASPPGATGYVKGITTARAVSLVEGLLGLTSIAIGWRAKVRSKKAGIVTALGLGLLAITLSIIHLSFSAGAVFGSGSGKAGAILALVFGLAGTLLSGKAIRLGFLNNSKLKL